MFELEAILEMPPTHHSPYPAKIHCSISLPTFYVVVLCQGNPVHLSDETRAKAREPCYGASHYNGTKDGAGWILASVNSRETKKGRP